MVRPEHMRPTDTGLQEKVWEHVRAAAEKTLREEPIMSVLLDEVVLDRNCLADAIAVRLARKLSRRDMSRDTLEPLIREALLRDPLTMECIAADLMAIAERDAACNCLLEPLLFFKGFHALATYRVAHVLWQSGRQMLALLFQSIGSEVFGIDIHPAARLGCGIFMDHGTGIVIGETAIVENNVSMLHEVTLGGTGKEKGGARHPVVRSGVLIGAGAKILGRIEIGEGAKIAASSVVLRDVTPHTTVAGVPAEVVGTVSEAAPALDMQQNLSET